VTASWEHSLACAWFDGEPCTCKDPLFPAGCTCLSYGHGLSMTRVDSPTCPVHRLTDSNWCKRP
jgi:hypothetical protein